MVCKNKKILNSCSVGLSKIFSARLLQETKTDLGESLMSFSQNL